MLASHTLMAANSHGPRRDGKVRKAARTRRQLLITSSSILSYNIIKSCSSTFCFALLASSLCSAVLVTRLAIPVFSLGFPDYSLILDWARTCGQAAGRRPRSAAHRRLVLYPPFFIPYRLTLLHHFFTLAVLATRLANPLWTSQITR